MVPGSVDALERSSPARVGSATLSFWSRRTDAARVPVQRRRVGAALCARLDSDYVETVELPRISVASLRATENRLLLILVATPPGNQPQIGNNQPRRLTPRWSFLRLRLLLLTP